MLLREQDGNKTVLIVPYAEGVTLDLRPLTAKLEKDPTLLTRNLLSLPTEVRLFRYQLQVMRCLAALILGRNRLVTDWLLTQELSSSTKLGLSYQIMLRSIQDPELPAVYRASQCTLMKALYIDREPCEATPHVSLVRVASFALSVNGSPRVKIDPWKGAFESL